MGGCGSVVAEETQSSTLLLAQRALGVAQTLMLSRIVTLCEVRWDGGRARARQVKGVSLNSPATVHLTLEFVWDTAKTTLYLYPIINL